MTTRAGLHTGDADASTASAARSVPLVRWAIALAAITVLSLLNWRWPVLRFHDHRANEVALLVLLLLPVAAAGLLAFALRGWRRILAVAALAPLLVRSSSVALLIGLGLPSRLPNPVDSSFEPIATTHFPSSRVVLYRTNCGATCDFGLEARHERFLIPRVLKVVRVLATWYPGQEGSVARLAGQDVRVTTDGVPRGGQAGPRDFALQPWIYF